jgi:fucose 4-O-acetylase-like acetyltransferase
MIISNEGRKIWIDYAKCFSIFLVVLFHTNPNLDGFVFDFLKLLRMPAFFLIAGFLFDIEKWNNFYKFIYHRLKRLIVPYFWFSIIFYILWLIVGRNMIGNEEMSINTFTPIIEFIRGTPKIILAPYWFITCLFSIQIVFYLLRKTIKSNILLLFISCSLYFIILITNKTNLPWCIDKALLYLPFYAFANILKTKTEQINYNNITLNITSIIFTLTLLYINQTINITYINHIIYITSGLCIIYAYVALCKYVAQKIGNIHIIKYIGDNNIITLALQNYIIGVIKIISLLLFSTNLLGGNYYIINILTTIITIAISMLFALIINKYTPFIIGKKNQ